MVNLVSESRIDHLFKRANGSGEGFSSGIGGGNKSGNDSDSEAGYREALRVAGQGAFTLVHS